MEHDAARRPELPGDRGDQNGRAAGTAAVDSRADSWRPAIDADPPRLESPPLRDGLIREPRARMMRGSPTAEEGRASSVYQWLVLLHLVGLLLFLATHSVSFWVAFRIRRERSREVVAALLGLSARGNQLSYVGLLALGIGGLGAAGSADLLLAPWVVGSYVTLGVVLVVMWTVGAGYYYGLRDAVNGTKESAPIGDEELVSRLDTRRPEILATVGGLGLLILVWLMALKPG
jgi:hypothetical protein